MKKVVIIGSTGSTGEQTIDVLRNESSIEILGLIGGNLLFGKKAFYTSISSKIVA